MLEDSVISQHKPLVASQEPFPKQLLVDEVIKPTQYLVHPSFLLESDLNMAQVSFSISNYY